MIQILASHIETLLQANPNQTLFAAIDGPSGSGKTFLAGVLARDYAGTVQILHMDDFYLPANRRPADFMQHPGSHMDFMRLLAVLTSLRQLGHAQYCPFSCATQTYGVEKTIISGPIILVEGTYSLHPNLHFAWDSRIFICCDRNVRMDRLRTREGDHFDAFAKTWIPPERAYLEQKRIQQSCDCIVRSDAQTRV